MRSEVESYAHIYDKVGLNSRPALSQKKISDWKCKMHHIIVFTLKMYTSVDACYTTNLIKNRFLCDKASLKLRPALL